MGIFNRTKEVKEAVPKTAISSRSELPFFNPRAANIVKYQNIYKQGGIVSQAIDAYPLFILCQGFELTGPTRMKKEITEWFYNIDVEDLIWTAVVDALIAGDAYAENVYSKRGDLLYVVPRDSNLFKIITDQYGLIKSYEYRMDNKITNLLPHQVTHTQIISDKVYGFSLIERALDDIKRDTMTAESSATAIQRHGFPRFSITVGAEGEDVPKETMQAISKEFRELKADNEFVHVRGIDIEPIDAGGVDNITEYNEWSTERLLAALGVPAEVVGVSKNTTVFATDTSVEMQSFIMKIQTIQGKIARTFNHLIDLKTGSPGTVKIIFNPIVPKENNIVPAAPKTEKVETEEE